MSETELADNALEIEELRRSLASAEVKLKQSEEKFIRLTDATSEAVFVHENGKPLETNGNFTRLFGYSLEDLKSYKKEPPFIAPESLALVMKHFNENSSEPYEAIGLKKDGTKFDIELSCKTFNQNGAKIGVVAIRDISRRKASLKELKLMALFAELNPGPVMRCCTGGFIQIGNTAAKELFGQDELETKSVGEVIPSAKGIDFAKCIKDNSIIEFSAPVGERYFQFTLRGVSNLGVVQIYGSEITGKKLAEDKLRETLAQMEAVLEGAGAGISLVKDNKVVWANSILEEIFNMKREDIYGKSIEMFFPSGEFQKRSESELWPTLEKGESVHTEDFLQRADGRSFWGRLIAKAVDPAELSKGIIWVIEDFTERKEMEEKLHDAKEKAEEATKLKDKFVSLVAHDLKSPFNSILGFLKIISNDRKNPLVPTHKNMVERAIASGTALVKMIEELLKISRLQTGKLQPKKTFFDGWLSAAYAITNFEALALEKGVRVSNDVPRGTRLYADVNLFGEVIQNLVSNAVKFCNKGDSISVFVPDDGSSMIAVKDTGVGINKKHMPKIFRHEETTSTKGTGGERGTGLGLPLSMDIMKAHGGNLRVESAEGEGSIFYAELPHMRPLVLLVDDDEVVRFMFKEIVEQIGLEVIEADNGEEALKILESKTPHLILTDVEMPIINGYELLENIKKNPKTDFIPVIVITSSEDIEVRQKVFGLGASDFVTKPLVVEDLIPRVRKHVG